MLSIQKGAFSMRSKRITYCLLGLALITTSLFLIPRYIWRLYGFKYCEPPTNIHIQSIEQYDGYFEITGGTTDSAASFVGYTYKENEANIEIGVKYNVLLGFLKRDCSFSLRIDRYGLEQDKPIYLTGADDRQLIGQIEAFKAGLPND